MPNVFGKSKRNLYAVRDVFEELFLQSERPDFWNILVFSCML